MTFGCLLEVAKYHVCRCKEGCCVRLGQEEVFCVRVEGNKDYKKGEKLGEGVVP